MWTYIGLFVAGMSFLYGAWMVVDTLAFGNPVRGYTSTCFNIILGWGSAYRNRCSR
jgi:hypothetical protein